MKSPTAAVAKSHGGEQSRKRLGETGQMRIREMNASELLMKCRKTLDEQNQTFRHRVGRSADVTCLRSVRCPA
jgi:hypothetical protein